MSIVTRLAGPVLAGVILAAGTATAETTPDGIHTEPWMNNLSFMDMPEDLQDALDSGREGLVVIWEQEGCGSCLKLHEKNFQRQALIDYIPENFAVMTMNMYGEKKVTTFDGETMPEKDWAQELRVNFSPTTVFFGEGGKEVFRMPGYFEPYYYLAGYVFVAERGYESEEHRGMFPRWLKDNNPRVQDIFGGPPGS